MSYIRSYIEVTGPEDEVARFKAEYITDDVLKDDIDNLREFKVVDDLPGRYGYRIIIFRNPRPVSEKFAQTYPRLIFRMAGIHNGYVPPAACMGVIRDGHIDYEEKQMGLEDDEVEETAEEMKWNRDFERLFFESDKVTDN